MPSAIIELLVLAMLATAAISMIPRMGKGEGQYRGDEHGQAFLFNVAKGKDTSGYLKHEVYLQIPPTQATQNDPLHFPF